MPKVQDFREVIREEKNVSISTTYESTPCSPKQFPSKPASKKAFRACFTEK
jgi:hypothetical protein